MPQAQTAQAAAAAFGHRPPSGRAVGGGTGRGLVRPRASGEATGSVLRKPTASGNWSWDGGTAVTVAAGETVDTIARRYGVPASAIMQANNIAAPATFIPASDWSFRATSRRGLLQPRRAAPGRRRTGARRGEHRRQCECSRGRGRATR